MKILLTSGYGDFAAGTYVDMADEDDAKRLLDLKAARELAANDKDPNFAADSAAVFTKVGKAKAAPAGAGG